MRWLGNSICTFPLNSFCSVFLKYSLSLFAASVFLSDSPESQVWVPGRCLCTQHGQSLGAVLCPHQAQQGQPGLPCCRLGVLHVALFPPSSSGAPQGSGQRQARLTGLVGGAGRRCLHRPILALWCSLVFFFPSVSHHLVLYHFSFYFASQIFPLCPIGFFVLNKMKSA